MQKLREGTWRLRGGLEFWQRCRSFTSSGVPSTGGNPGEVHKLGWMGQWPARGNFKPSVFVIVRHCVWSSRLLRSPCRASFGALILMISADALSAGLGSLLQMVNVWVDHDSAKSWVGRFFVSDVLMGR